MFTRMYSLCKENRMGFFSPFRIGINCFTVNIVCAWSRCHWFGVWGGGSINDKTNITLPFPLSPKQCHFEPVIPSAFYCGIGAGVVNVVSKSIDWYNDTQLICSSADGVFDFTITQCSRSSRMDLLAIDTNTLLSFSWCFQMCDRYTLRAVIRLSAVSGPDKQPITWMRRQIHFYEMRVWNGGALFMSQEKQFPAIRRFYVFIIKKLSTNMWHWDVEFL